MCGNQRQRAASLQRREVGIKVMHRRCGIQRSDRCSWRAPPFFGITQTDHLDGIHRPRCLVPVISDMVKATTCALMAKASLTPL